MFKFLSLFRRDKDERLNDNEYDFNEVPISVIDVDGAVRADKPALTDVGGSQRKDASPPSPPTHVDRTGEEARIEEIRGDLRERTDREEVYSSHAAVDKKFFDPNPVTPEELKKQKPTDFGFRLEPPIRGQEPGNAHFLADEGGTTIAAYFPTDIRGKLTEEQRELYDISDDGRTVSYPKQDKQLGDERYKFPFMMGELPMRSFPEGEPHAEILTAEKVAEMIHDVPGDGLVIYTGAGISKGGENPVWDMGTLQHNLQVNKGSDAFLQTLLDNPEALIDAFNTFHQQLNTMNPTPAHMAIAEIMKAKPGATLLTQNGDRNHEASGARPIHPPEELTSKKIASEFYEFLAKQTDKASLIVTVGLNGDDISFLKWAATKNPHIKIVAVDLRYPSFLGKDDGILPGDAQKTIREVADALKGK